MNPDLQYMVICAHIYSAALAAILANMFMKPLFASIATAKRYPETLIHTKVNWCNRELSLFAIFRMWYV